MAATAVAVAWSAGGRERPLVALSPLLPAPAPSPVVKGLIPWPRHEGFTIILAARPAARGLAAARELALEARRAGLPEVGILLSSRYPDLHPGYYLVFSGVYDTLEEAQSRLPRAGRHFPAAYARHVVPPGSLTGKR